jgi:zinc protease
MTRSFVCMMFGSGLLAFAFAAMSSANPQDRNAPVLLPVPDDPTVTLEVWFRTGSQDDPAGKEGLAYLTGQMLAEGATSNNSYEAILKKLYPLATSYDVRVDKEMTTIGGRAHRDNLEKFFALFADAYLHPKFDAADFERLKSDQQNFLEKTLRYASDEELAKAALHGAVFDGTPYRCPPEGTVEGVKSITLDDVKAFYKNHYTRDNAVPALGGGYTDDFRKRFEMSLAGLPASHSALTPTPAPQPPPVHGREVTIVSKQGADCSISFGCPVDVHRGERDFYALWIASSWLGEHRSSSSHLYQVIREARGMNYGDYSYIEFFPHGGERHMPAPNAARRQQLFEVWIRTLPNPNAHFALRAAMREVQNLVDGGMTQEQFELTRSFLSKYSLHFAPTTAERLGYAIDDRFYGVDGEGNLARFRKMMGELTLADVNAAIHKHLQYANLKIAMVTGDADGLKQALVAGTPSPMKYDSAKPPELLAEDKLIESFPLGIRVGAVRVVPVEEFLQK